MTSIHYLVTAAAGALMAGAAVAAPPSFSGLGVPAGAVETRASGLSANGSIITGTAVYVPGFIGESEAFKWTAVGGFELLGDLNGGAFQSFGAAVSNNGSVVAGIGSVSGAPCHNNIFICPVYRRAFRWEDGGMTKLGALTNGQDVYSGAAGVSGDGETIIGNSIFEPGYG